MLVYIVHFGRSLEGVFSEFSYALKYCEKQLKLSSEQMEELVEDGYIFYSVRIKSGDGSVRIECYTVDSERGNE